MIQEEESHVSGMSRAVQISSRSSVTSTRSLPNPLPPTYRRKSHRVQDIRQGLKTDREFLKASFESNKLLRNRPEARSDRDSLFSLKTLTSQKTSEQTANDGSKIEDSAHTPLDTSRPVPIVQWQKITSVPATERTDNSVVVSAPVDLKKCLTCGADRRILKLLPCLHSFCQQCLEIQIQEHPR